MVVQTRPQPLPFLVTTEMPCPYLPGRVERKVVTDLSGPAAMENYEILSRAGFRRSHSIAYRPACPGCSACVAVRVVVGSFVPGPSLRRIERRNDDLAATLRLTRGTPEQFALFTRYLGGRHQDGEMVGMSLHEYVAMVEDSPLHSNLVELRDGRGRLVGCCLVDWTRDGVSAVYSFYDVDQPRRSLGSYLILWLIREAARRGLPYAYLGYWVAGSRKMAYKSRFRPLEGYGPNGWQRLADRNERTRPEGETMKRVGRRRFIAGAGVAGAGALAASLPAPAIAQAQPELKWRLASSFPKSLDTIYGGAEDIAAYVAAMTDGKFQIRAFAAGEIVPAFQVLETVQKGTVELGHSASYYYVGKDPTFAFDTAIPMGLNTRQQNAWLYRGGGLELLREFFKDYNIVPIPAGDTGTQMGGWFRKEIKTVDDLSGLKFRIGGFAGKVLAKLGVVPQQIPGGDIYPALEKGTIDAAEWVGPYDDEKLGFNKVAKYYYYPGWWEGCAQLSLYVNADQWNSLPKAYQAILESACAKAKAVMVAKYDTQNPPALKRLVAGGTQIKPYSHDIMVACYKAAFDLYDETAATNEKFKKIYEAWKPFRQEEYLWFRVAENTFDNFVYSQQAAKK